MRRFILFVALFYSFSSIANAAIYQYIDDDGNITYSDKLVQGAKKLKESKPSVVPKPTRQLPATRPNTDVKAQSKTKNESKAKAKRYGSISILSPKDDQAVRGNNGDVKISLALKPALQTAFGHQIQLLFDGSALPGTWQSSNILLKEVDRGTHTLLAVIIDKSGKKLKQSKKITFHLLRHSILMSR